ncbi:MAG TPA: proline iminopeptidase-family hydrolase [Thermomicrobiales bacterium]|jgi:proline-specific peptidase
MTRAAAGRAEGYVDVGPGRVWYESAGEGPTLLMLHGGPGGSSEDFAPMMTLAEEGYRVVRYDQLGSWRSDKPDDASLWQFQRFVDEVETVRRALDLGRVHLLGQSWGSFLALEYALQHQENLKSLILGGGAASTAECVAGMDSLRRQLPAEAQDVLARCEAAGQTEDPEYLAAMTVLYKRHLCRLDPWPEELTEALHHMGPAYQTMWGPNEFTCTGNLRGWDRTGRLGEIRVPTLITCGRYDEVVPSCSETMRRGIPGAELVVFEESAHMVHFEEPERYFAVLRDFLRRAETGRAAKRS